jgi:hypothetical protein
MGAYVVFPLVVALVDWNRLATRRLLLVGVLLLAALWGYFAMQGVGRLGERVSQMGLVRCLLEFWLGNVLRLLWGRWCGVAGAATAAWLAAVAALLGGLALGWHETSFIPACFAALILALALDKGLPARAGRPVARLYGRDQLFHLSGALSAVRAVQAGLCGGAADRLGATGGLSAAGAGGLGGDVSRRGKARPALAERALGPQGAAAGAAE